MSMIRIAIVAVAFSLIGWITPAGLASADYTTAGDFGAGAGCSPPSSGSDNTESWPPTSVDWPPQLKSATDNDSDSDSKGGDAKSTPIVMPDGQKPPPATTSSDSTSKSAPAKPIVPVGSVSTVATTSTTPTPIVAPQH